MKRCTNCRGRGHVSLFELGPDRKVQLLMEGTKIRKDAEGNEIDTCPVCNGKGFLNPRFK